MDTIIRQMKHLNLEPPEPTADRPEVAIVNTMKFLYDENRRLKLYIEFLKQSLHTKHKSIPEWVL
jgi:hypothetical protein